MDGELLFGHLLDRPAAATCLVADGRRQLAGPELRELADRIASGLRARDLQPGDRVAIRLPNQVEVVLAAFGASRAGLVFTLLGPRLREPELRYILADCGAAALVCAAGDAPALAAARALPEPPALFTVDGREPGAVPWAELETTPGPPPRPGRIDLDVAALFYTSGSTGFPKGVMLSHRNLRFTAWSIATYLDNHPGDRILATLPLSFDYGFSQAATAIQAGAAVFLEREFLFPAAVLPRIAELGITGFPLVPAMLAMIFRLRRPEEFDLSGLRYVTNTAQALPVPLLRRFRALWPGVKVFAMYGLTECTRALWLPPAELDEHPDAVGYPIPGTEAWVEREDGGRAAPGEAGELVVRGSHVMLGYWHDEAATASCLRPGPGPGGKVLRTGDLFAADAAGRLRFQGRRDDLIKVAGCKVYPLEVERAALSFPGVVEACLVGLPDPLQGMKLRLFLALAPGSRLDRAALHRHLLAALEEEKIPREVAVLESLPRTGTGKVDRRALAAGESGPA